MGKPDELRRTAGGNVAESASRREAPVLAAAAPAGLDPARMEGVARSNAAPEIPLEKIDRDPTRPGRARSSTRGPWPAWSSRSGPGGPCSPCGCGGPRGGADMTSAGGITD
jgi:hypothetical protein